MLHTFHKQVAFKKSSFDISDFLHLRSHLTRIFCLFDSPHPSLLAPVYITPYTRDRSYYTCFCHICLPFELSFKLERRYEASDKSIFSSGKSSPKTEKLTVNLPWNLTCLFLFWIAYCICNLKSLVTFFGQSMLDSLHLFPVNFGGTLIGEKNYFVAYSINSF